MISDARGALTHVAIVTLVRQRDGAAVRSPLPAVATRRHRHPRSMANSARHYRAACGCGSSV